MPYVCRWGILATGGIAESFAKDLLVDPSTRSVTKIRHTITAAASSSGASRARKFLEDLGVADSASSYGSYEELAQDPNVDIIYVATPHSHHFQNVMLCLEAGRNVLCEKAFTVNAAQTRVLIDKAREKNLFLMEAVWTRYFPLSEYLTDTILNGTIGSVQRVIADLSVPTDPDVANSESLSRIEDPKTAGGALLELGVYPINWCFQAIYNVIPADIRSPPSVKAVIKKYPSGVDETTSMILVFPRPSEYGGDAHAFATCSITPGSRWRETRAPQPSVRILGTKGELELYHPSFRPARTRLMTENGDIVEKTWPHPGPGKGSNWYNWYRDERLAEGEARGMAWQADEAATALSTDQKESSKQSLEESLVIMQVMDEVRRQGDLVYSEELESTAYPLQL
ncbi:dimeric dihydrodiol dehydrogenase [Rhizodiscina lignyota]|uniref:D-xylose 1-dehydrogenase (NADP(+), D-xylono-1,5-lactone-forming) n=1 Tax=Rhizodiscina lignyota TaxID=1504668 RepID=A0A9P4MAZ1_9PEZI|nr:dimeric dihydrodiol dehydrogenase [Rhizodiscina lignyota]